MYLAFLITTIVVASIFLIFSIYYFVLMYKWKQEPWHKITFQILLGLVIILGLILVIFRLA